MLETFLAISKTIRKAMFFEALGNSFFHLGGRGGVKGMGPPQKIAFQFSLYKYKCGSEKLFFLV